MINYHTKNINKRLVQRSFENVLMNLGIYPHIFLKLWDIDIFDLSKTNTLFFKHIKTTSGQKINPNMPSGVTGKFVMTLYLHDSSNEFKERENSDRIQHEICHAILYSKNRKLMVSGVHSTTKRFMISFWYWKKYFWKKTYISIIDIRKHLE